MIVNMKGQPLHLEDLSKPIPIPRVTLIFKHSHLDYYKPINAPAKMWIDAIGLHHYIRRQDITKAMFFTNVEIEE